MIKMEIPELMLNQYKQAKELIENSSDIKIYSHISFFTIIHSLRYLIHIAFYSLIYSGIFVNSWKTLQFLQFQYKNN